MQTEISVDIIDRYSRVFFFFANIADETGDIIQESSGSVPLDKMKEEIPRQSR